MKASFSLSPSLENYLEVILSLEEENLEVRITDLAEKLNIAKSSVNQGVTRLAQNKLVIYSKYSPIQLTASGRQRARQIRKKHCILKNFLETVLRVPSQIAEKEACLMEHVVSNDTIEKLEIFMKDYSGGKEIKPSSEKPQKEDSRIIDSLPAELL